MARASGFPDHWLTNSPSDAACDTNSLGRSASLVSPPSPSRRRGLWLLLYSERSATRDVGPSESASTPASSPRRCCSPAGSCSDTTAEDRRGRGLSPNHRRVAELAAGFAIGVVLFSAVALVRGEAVGASWRFHGWAGAEAALVGLPLTLALLLPEELLFRGYAFRKLVAAIGAPLALGISSVAFGLYHLLGSGNWGMGAVFTFLLPALGGLVFGFAALRTGGLALPIGLHLGGNWVQSSLFGLGTGGSAVSGVWSARLSATQLHTLYAPDLSRHLPYLLALGLAAYLLRYLRPELHVWVSPNAYRNER